MEEKKLKKEENLKETRSLTRKQDTRKKKKRGVSNKDKE